MKRLLRKAIDSVGISIFKNGNIPVGTDYRKTIRNIYGEEGIRTVFDVGANVGQFCLPCNEIFREAKIYSFEPVNTTYERLKANTAKYNNITCINKACGETNKTDKIILQSDSRVNSLRLNFNGTDVHTKNVQEVKVITIDSFCKENSINSIDLLKIDTEGYDLNVLKGGMQMLIEQKIKFILIEVTFDTSNDQNSFYFAISEFLERYNFKIHGFYNQSIHTGSTRMNYCDALFYLQS